MINSLPIQWRLTLFNASAIGAILVVLGFTLCVLLRGALLSGVENTARSRAVTAAQSIRTGDYLSSDDVEHLTLDGVFVIIRDGKGKVLSRTVKLTSRNGDGDAVWRQALKTGAPAEGTVKLSSETPDYVYAIPVNPPGGTTRVVEAGKSYETTQQTIGTLITVLIIGISVAFVLSVGGAYLLA
jgi:two-component system, OmpR family, sensor kinase